MAVVRHGVPLSLWRLVRREVGGEGVAAEVEDPLEVAAHEEAVGELAQGPVGNGVADAVADRASVLTVRLEDVGVLPERVGPVDLGVAESQRRLPGLDPRLPANWEAVQAQPVIEQRSRAHRDRLRRRHPEVEPWGRHRLEVDGGGVEVEGALGRDGDALAALQDVLAHRRQSRRPAPLVG